MKSPQIVVFYDRKGKIGKMETDKFMSTYAHRTEFLDDAVERFNREKQMSGEDTFAKVEFTESKKDKQMKKIEEKLTIATVKKELGDLGISIKKVDDEFIVNFKGGKEATAYYTDDLEDALGTGKAMAKEKKKESIIEIKEEVQIGDVILEAGDKIEVMKESIMGFEAKIEKEDNGLRIIKLVNPNLNPKRGRFQFYLLMDEENTLIDYSTTSGDIYRTFYRIVREN